MSGKSQNSVLRPTAGVLYIKICLYAVASLLGSTSIIVNNVVGAYLIVVRILLEQGAEVLAFMY